jgi:hypothetical protein
MAINIAVETLLTLSQAARLRPPGRAGRPTHPSTPYRWATRGVRGHRLEVIRLGGVTYTSREALQRFAVRLTADAAGPPAPPLAPDRRAADAAAAELDRRGL